MSIQKYYTRACLIVALLLSACGGGSTDAPPKVVNLVKPAYVYMAGNYVEGLTYSAKTLSGSTGPKGLFMYRVGEPVTFSIGNKVIGNVDLPAYQSRPVTHFDILGTNNPRDPNVINLSVLLSFLGDASSSGQTGNIKINPDRLALANNIKKGLFTDTRKVDPDDFIWMLGEQAKRASPPITVPDKGTVLALAKAQTIADKIQIRPYPSLILPPVASLSSRYLPCSAPNPNGFNFDFNEFKSTVTLSASNSDDANGDSLTYKWSIDSKPKTSKAVIASPTLDTITVGIDADDEPYVFRLFVSDPFYKDENDAALRASCTANVKKTNIAGVYSVATAQPPGPSVLGPQVLAISDTAEIWGYTASTVFAGVVTPSDTLGTYALSSLISCQQDVSKAPPAACTTQQLLSGGALKLENGQPPRTLTGSIGADQLSSLTSNTATDAPTLFTSLAGNYQEYPLGSTAKVWTFSKTTFSFTDTVTTTTGGKTTSTPTLCASGDIKVDATSQVLDANGAVTKYAIPIKIDFKAACNDGFNANSSTTGVLFPDPSFDKAGYTFIGKNPSQSAIFVRHFIRQ
jgi:hypothetical protein